MPPLQNSKSIQPESQAQTETPLEPQNLIDGQPVSDGGDRTLPSTQGPGITPESPSSEPLDNNNQQQRPNGAVESSNPNATPFYSDIIMSLMMADDLDSPGFLRSEIGYLGLETDYWRWYSPGNISLKNSKSTQPESRAQTMSQAGTPLRLQNVTDRQPQANDGHGGWLLENSPQTCCMSRHEAQIQGNLQQQSGPDNAPTSVSNSWPGPVVGSSDPNATFFSPDIIRSMMMADDLDTPGFLRSEVGVLGFKPDFSQWYSLDEIMLLNST